MSATMRILDIPKRPDPRLVVELARMVTPHLSDSMERLYSAGLGAGSYPVYAAGGTHRGPYKNGPGEINVPVVIGGMPVNPGDIIVGDADGLVAVPQDQAERVLASAKSILEKETASMKQILAGTVDRSWVDKALKEKGYKI